MATADGTGHVMRTVANLALMLGWLAGSAGAAAQPMGSATPGAVEAAASLPRISTCDVIENSAAASGLSVDYFTRLIWRESSFRAEAVSPVGAQGIAQFMPGTAVERGLVDPFDPLQAIPASAELLKALADRFGNVGLAAAAYNSGPRRVEEWLAGTGGGLPLETRTYVAAITGRTAEEWRDLGPDAPADAPSANLTGTKPERGPATCLEVLAVLDAPPSTADALQAPEPQAEWQPWGVQLAGNFSQSRALAVYRGLQKRHPEVLGDRLPLIVRQLNRSFGSRPMVHVRVPEPTRQAANELCGELRAAGAACAVLKN